jgi:hypothetical protein
VRLLCVPRRDLARLTSARASIARLRGRRRFRRVSDLPRGKATPSRARSDPTPPSRLPFAAAPTRRLGRSPEPRENAVVCHPPGYDNEGDGSAGETKRRRPMSNFQPYKLMKVEPDGTPRPLTNAELKEFEKSHSTQCEWNKPLKSCARQWQKQCLNVLKKMTTQKKLSWAFNEPVDPVALGIPDYPAIIKHPMDLKTIEGLLLSGAITTPDEFTALCRTVFRNAFVYNKPGQADGVRECAEKLSLVFEKEILKL